MPRQKNRSEMTQNQKAFIYHQYNGQCEICGTTIEGLWKPYPKYTHWGAKGLSAFYILEGEIHHRIPLWQGGNDTLGNKVLLCCECHRQYHKLLPIRYGGFNNG